MVKKRALKWLKQQVSALLHGEDLSEGAQAREVAEVPYQIPAAQGRPRTAWCVSSLCYTPQVNGTHGGELRAEYPCDKCEEVLANTKKVEKAYLCLCSWSESGMTRLW